MINNYHSYDIIACFSLFAIRQSPQKKKPAKYLFLMKSRIQTYLRVFS